MTSIDLLFAKSRIARRKVSKFLDVVMRSNAGVSREGSKLTRDINVHLYARVDLLCVNGTEIENRVALGAIIAGQLERATFVARLGLNYRDGCAAWKILSRSIDHRELV